MRNLEEIINNMIDLDFKENFTPEECEKIAALWDMRARVKRTLRPVVTKSLSGSLIRLGGDINARN